MVLTGVIIALLCGQMYSGKNARGQLRRRMKQDDGILATWLYELAYALELGTGGLPALTDYEKQLQEDRALAADYLENSYASHADYFAEYFDMRIKQVEVLKNLEWELASYQVPRHRPGPLPGLSAIWRGMCRKPMNRRHRRTG